MPDAEPPAAAPARPFTALVLAGSRPGGDPLARAAGVSHKALAPVAGVPMLARVLATLRAARAVGRLVVCGMPADALAGEPTLQATLAGGELALMGGGATPSASVLASMEALGDCTPLLVATADHPLLTPALVDEFCARSADSGADVTVGLVPAALVRSAFPTVRRTTVPFRDGAFCGCNLFAFLTPEARRAPAAWMAVERHRKRPWRMVGALGVGSVLRFVLRRLTVAAVMDLASDRMGVRVRPVVVSAPEAGFDVDTITQLAAAEAFLQRRAAAGPAFPPRR
ncbi:nucleotidyltransferase family protein [bacterium]|nr:nucleotidyltransferase family protein [bacterium]